MLKNSIHLQKNRLELIQAKLVFYLFIASLAMFFLATLVSYLIIRNQAFHQLSRDYIPLSLPITFWISTGFLILASVSLQGAVWQVRRERIKQFRIWVIASLISSILFVGFQAIGMQQLATVHFAEIDGSAKIYGLCLTLAFVHALHVIGGVVFVAYILVQSYRKKYDHERHWAVDNCAGYWHFLDVVWFAMLLTFLITK